MKKANKRISLFDSILYVICLPIHVSVYPYGCIDFIVGARGNPKEKRKKIEISSFQMTWIGVAKENFLVLCMCVLSFIFCTTFLLLFISPHTRAVKLKASLRKVFRGIKFH